MKHNVFDNDNNDEVLQHSEILASAIEDAKKYGSLRESVIEHAAINNITDICNDNLSIKYALFVYVLKFLF